MKVGSTKDICKYFHIAVYIATLIFWVWIFFNAPYEHDDWYWGSPAGINAWLGAGPNSRYVGNMTIVLMTNSVVFKALFGGFVMWLIPLCISIYNLTLDRNNRLIVFLFANLLLVCMSNLVWKQVVGWISGYANYVPSALCAVLYFVIIRRNFENTQSRFSFVKALGIFLFAFASMLYVENLTVYFMAVAAAAFVVAVIRKKNVRYMASLLLGAVPGAVIMFSNPLYKTLAEEGVVGYREVSITTGANLGSVLEMAWEMYNQHLPGMYEINALACIFVLIAVCVLLLLFTGKKHPVTIIFVLLNSVMAVFLLMYLFGASIPAFLIREDGNTYISSIFFPLVTLEHVWLIVRGEDKRSFLDISFLFVSTFFVIAPLLVTKASGIRLYFSVLVLLIMYTCEVYSYVAKSGFVSVKIGRCLTVVLSAALLLSAGYMANVYRVIGNIDREHERIIAEARVNGNKDICLPLYLPLHEKYLSATYVSDGVTETSSEDFYTYYYKIFHEIDVDVSITYCEFYD